MDMDVKAGQFDGRAVAFVPAPYFRIWRQIDRLAEGCGRLRGGRRWGVAFLLGAAASLAMPPVFAFPLLWICFPLIVWMLQGARTRRGAFAIGWWFGFGLYVASLYWISHALIVFSDRLLWMVPFAAIGLPAFFALFTGLAAGAASLLRSGPARIAGFAAFWCAAEWLRGHLFTGFPWNALGHGWMGFEALMQPAAAIGLWGLTALAVASACLPALAANAPHRRRFAVLAGALALPLIAAGYGSVRLATAPEFGFAAPDAPGVRLVQANIPQNEKWRRDLLLRNFGLHLDLSRADRPDWIDVVVWPETAAAFYLADDEVGLRQAARAAPEGGWLITGAPRQAGSPPRLHNSIIVLDETGEVAATYDKSHLVPFGEYMPLSGVFGVEKVTGGKTDFTPGDGVRTVRLDGLPGFSPLVCYEVIFPGAVADRNDPPQWLLNVTNDAWYGRTAGPHQHLTMARLRAVEEGLPLVRATNTGITVAFDAYGREIGRLGLAAQGALDLRLPPPLGRQTAFAMIGDAAFWGFVALMAAAAVLAHRRAASQEERDRA